MKTKLFVFCFLFHLHIHAQTAARNKRTFERSLALIVNTAADNFEFIKGKSVKERDPAFNGKQFQLNVLLPGVDHAFLLSNKNYAEVYINVSVFRSFEDAFDLYTNLIDQTDEALRKRVYFCTDTLDRSEGTKITTAGVKTMTGFFAPNMQINLEKRADGFYLFMKITGGVPLLYSVIPKGQTAQSVLFKYQFDPLKSKFESGGMVSGELPGYVSSFNADGNITYEKLFDEELNAKYEFSNLFTELKASLKETYVYFHSTPAKNKLLETCFIRKEDICTTNRKNIHISLTKTDDRLYKLTITFQYLQNPIL